MNNVVEIFRPHRIVPVVVANSLSEGIGIGSALAAGGIPIAEVTFRTPVAADVMAALVERGEVLVGAGTVTTAEQVDIAAAVGARFLVSPGLSMAVADRAREHGIPLIPGAVTATEVQNAIAHGFTTLKFFPAESSGSIAAVRALAAPFGDVSFVPTGGIGAGNASDYLAEPCVAAVGGSWMLPRTAIAEGDWKTITSLTSLAVGSETTTHA
ncbi:2-dehydro-3-deoxyphosphogluconate aldolase/(4S)-4-hydroxy-2-oxoglutarate aldolase [Microbacterium endophyticum]|uniref:2-dehydro-3-deoxy-phosphogluconate aldolase n=1 Tax=Microbacterium endophyticum TaxID=1526412 RepID=A0A7W4V2A9_9MICO|nr:bifunctional 4-hydroxy-2-oxoglutarate aldolase/2-dehydro-3-deoxy-phosphogluconate aldolase [Microbacterium endophyticum]MBB2975510.1 2-dehydro-3-deoxyphosphogluconate aldolase/(4S)-4-hydroxy-2-oxoglutarate aldolase [Microbacterium endophyticum]NIK35471.1 2-dehydro-3-deoxyphosphogluconate aldolase/(4S)-4-hydroxy-2-oxoglutarate aldolase [Microbacterium endophyticum]